MECWFLLGFLLFPVLLFFTHFATLFSVKFHYFINHIFKLFPFNRQKHGSAEQAARGGGGQKSSGQASGGPGKGGSMDCFELFGYLFLALIAGCSSLATFAGALLVHMCSPLSKYFTRTIPPCNFFIYFTAYSLSSSCSLSSQPFKPACNPQV